eukprot:6186303-Pleurochrysis_carterae.AAC.3
MLRNAGCALVERSSASPQPQSPGSRMHKNHQSQGSRRKRGESKAEAQAFVGVFQQTKLTTVKRQLGKQTKNRQASSHMSL